MEQLQVERTKQNVHFEQIQLTTGMIQQDDETLQHMPSTEELQEWTFLFGLIENEQQNIFHSLVFNVAKPFKPQKRRKISRKYFMTVIGPGWNFKAAAGAGVHYASPKFG